MSGKARNLSPHDEGIFHIFNRGNNGNEIFNCEEDFQTFISVIQSCKEKYDISFYHYCILINHYHFIVRATGEMLAKSMKWIDYGYSMKHRAKYGREGRLWQSRYKSKVIESEGYLFNCIGYVEMNAIKHNIVTKPEDYRWTSYHKYAFGKSDPIVDANPDYFQLAESESDRRNIYQKLGGMWSAEQLSRNPKWMNE